MNYLDVFYSRINHMGNSTAERIREAGTRSFYKWLAESPHTMRNLSVERGIYFDGIILTSKDKEERKILLLNVSNDTEIVIGDILNLQTDDGAKEKWLLYIMEKKVNGTYKTFSMIKCNYLLKWIDNFGHLQSSWAYVVSSVDSKIKGNFRTWNNLITPQPNKYAEILMPRYPIERSTNFIIEDESWTVIEYDHTSVQGVIYLSLTENKVNLIYDDTINNIADLDKLAQYTILTPENNQEVTIGEQIIPVYSILKNGYPIKLNTSVVYFDKNFVEETNGQFFAKNIGNTKMKIQIDDFPFIEKEINILIKEKAEFSAFIDGAEKINLDHIKQYELKGTQELNGDIIFSIDSDLAKIIRVENNICYIQANNNNQLGTVILSASYNNAIYTKSITIVPVWQR